MSKHVARMNCTRFDLHHESSAGGQRQRTATCVQLDALWTMAFKRTAVGKEPG
mgnify:CR=1 FL=1